MSVDTRKSSTSSVAGLNTSMLSEGEVTNRKEDNDTPETFHDARDADVKSVDKSKNSNILDVASKIEQKLNELINTVEENDKSVEDKISKIMDRVSALEKKLT